MYFSGPPETLVGMAGRGGGKTLPTDRDKALMQVIADEWHMLGGTQQAMADRLGVTQGSVSRMWRGKQVVTLTELQEMLDAVGLSLSEAATRAGV